VEAPGDRPDRSPLNPALQKLMKKDDFFQHTNHERGKYLW
jgi:hypothetical protein